ncbi:WXG100 family type VII secretion target [Actinoplanes sp. TFC3]|uniref:WXG100 family type VII secretion target n=1 Tax=Actinoplanes sp. TFC3 TaxID=1710355 RepID=UPI00083463E4|nr:WXG100 family type VII secretion target [Actinoplanes sp. TFC3]
MTLPHGRLWVNPEGVSQVGDTYAEHVQLYQQYLEQLQSLRDRYADSWGDDDMGTQFSKKFLGGMDNLEQLIGGVKGTLNYTAEGLRESGKAYRDADDQAAEAGHKMAANFESTLPATPLSATRREVDSTQQGEPLRVMRAMTTQERVLRPAQPTQESERAGILESGPITREVRTRVPAAGVPNGETVDTRGEVTDLEMEPLQARRMLARPADAGLEPLQPTTPGVPASPGLEPLQPTLPARMPGAAPVGMMTSSHLMRVDYFGAQIGGEPLPEGYRLEALNPLPDGTTRVDANRYDSITPVNGAEVTGANGQPLDAGGGQFVVVKENPDVDPLAEGYQPMYLGFNPDGTPIPLIPGQ